MSDRKKINRDDQRRARILARDHGISYMQALDRVNRGGTPAAGMTGAASTVTGWLKSLHYRHDGWTIEPGATTWISDIGRHARNGDRVYRRDGMPWGEPSWKLKDRVGLYLSGTLRVPILVEVIAPPRFDPDFVQKYNDGGEPDAGERWPWVTEVRGVLRVPLAQSPTLDDIGVGHSSVRQRPRLILSPNQLRNLDRALR